MMRRNKKPQPFGRGFCGPRCIEGLGGFPSVPISGQSVCFPSRVDAS